jgi:alpha-L-fucosidase/alpha-L-arabinofuranosidase
MNRTVSFRRWLASFTRVCCAVLLTVAAATVARGAEPNLPIAEGPYQPTPESLKQYRYPDWFRDAKFGIWAHWGPQAVPMDGDWYARGMYEPGNKHYKYHLEHYGHPSEFGYKDIIPLWKAEKWDPDRLMALYKRAGAKYFVSMGSHHDNFFLWNSKLHRWNAVNMGPHRDVVGEWQKAAQKYGLKFGVSEHLGASFTWFQSSHRADKEGPKAGVPYDGAKPEYQDLYHFPAEPDDTGWYSKNPRWHQQWYNAIKELVDNYHPDLLYTDGGVPFGNEVGYSLIAHLYNDSAARSSGQAQVVYTCKQLSEGRWVEDLERGIMPRIDPYPWQTDTSIGDWYYNRNWKFRPVSWVIHMLVDNVSKNGNLLLNVVQRPDGSLDPEVEQMLEELAAWNDIHGEGIFGTRPWLVYGESTVKVRGGAFAEDFKYNANEIRFTTKAGALYAFTLGWPEDRKIVIRSLAMPVGSDVNRIQQITLLGYDGKLDWRQTTDGLTVTLPEQKVSEYTAALKITGSNLTNVPYAAIDAGQTFAPINPNLYGMFIEHAGGLVYRGMWAEMLDDRKFHNPIKSEDPDAAAQQRGRRGGGMFGGPPRRWTPVGPAESVTMDAERAYAGDHSPAIALSASEPHGIRQAGLALLQGKEYTGRIVLSGDPATQVSVSLVWGTGATDLQTVTVGKLTSEYAKFPLSFKSPVDATDGKIEITATGPGVVRIGAVSLMPSDNVQGWRHEVIEVLKSLRSGLYRWPGGNFVSAHEWRDAIGDPDRRPPVFDPVWRTLQSNDVGTDEFMALCRLVGVEPYITVNSGFGDARSAAEYVEYANGAVTTRMGAMRAANGHPEPYNVKYWNIGNEMWGSYQYGYMPLAQYAVKHNLFAKEMRKVDPSIILIASGAMPDTMTGSKESLKLGDKLIPEYLGPADWTGFLFQNCLDNMDMISEHYYNYDSHFDLAQAKQVPNDPNEPLIDWMRRPANHIRIKYEEYQEYLRRIPALRKKRIPIALDEYAYARGGNYKVVPAYAWNFHEMFRHSDLYQLATLTFVTGTYSAARGQAVLNTTGMLFKLYRDHFGTIPVNVSGNSPQPNPTDPPGGEQPVVHAGSDTFPLDVVAAWTADRKALTVAVVNPTESAQTLRLEIRGAELSGKGTLRRMAPQSLTATVVVGQEPGVKIEELSLDAVPTNPTFAPFSVSIYEFPVKSSPQSD